MLCQLVDLKCVWYTEMMLTDYNCQQPNSQHQQPNSQHTTTKQTKQLYKPGNDEAAPNAVSTCGS